jgi:hypothetical protein
MRVVVSSPMAWSRVRGHPDRAEVHILMMGRTITGIAAFS